MPSVLTILDQVTPDDPAVPISVVTVPNPELLPPLRKVFVGPLKTPVSIEDDIHTPHLLAVHETSKVVSSETYWGEPISLRFPKRVYIGPTKIPLATTADDIGIYQYNPLIPYDNRFPTCRYPKGLLLELISATALDNKIFVGLSLI